MVSNLAESKPAASPHAFDPKVIRDQMERIVLSAHFRQSRRYPVLLRYVVERTLDGRAEDLKERTLGVEVFQRSADYDTNLDPIVRITAGEVRKRIAQYYHDDGHSDELRIDLPAGSYVPQFRYNLDRPLSQTSSLVDSLSLTPLLPMELPAPTAAASKPRRPVTRFFWIACSAGVLFLLLGFGVARWEMRDRAGLDAIWAPMLTSNIPLLISAGTPELLSNHKDEKPDLSVRGHLREQDQMVFSDVKALTALASFTQTQHHAYNLQIASNTTYADLRSGPAVLLGGFDNAWTMRSVEGLRYRFRRDTITGQLWIEDRRNPTVHPWEMNFDGPYSRLGSDYAIVARFTDENTHQPVMIAAGIGENGTKAAAEFLTDPAIFQSLMGPQTLRSSNFEVVLQTRVIDGVSGPPRLLAKEVW